MLRCGLFVMVSLFAMQSTALAGKAKPSDPLGGLPRIHFYIAKSDSGICGDGCSEWIAAEGAFDTGAGARFIAFLRKLPKQKLPIYFNSPGGNVDQALIIGRVMRDRGLTASVGRTILEGCDPLREKNDDSCRALKTSGKVLSADLRAARSMCNSACVYALVGAAERQVPAGSRLGVHSGKVVLFRLADGTAIAPGPGTEARERRSLERLNDKIDRYLKEMKIDPQLLRAANEISHDRVRFLSRDEVARFGIDRRDFQESRWMVDEGPPGPFAVIKFITEAKGNDRDQYRTTHLRLTCLDAKSLRIDFSRELATDDGGVAVPIQLTTQESWLVFRPRRSKPVSGYNDVLIDDRVERVPIDTLQAASAASTIDIAEAPQRVQVDRPPRVTKVSTAGLASSLTALRERCR